MGDDVIDRGNFLKNMTIFSDLDDRALASLGNLFVQKDYQSGNIIFEEDSRGNSMMVIMSGEVRISQRADADSEEALIILKKGDLFGEMALLEDLPRSATAIAHTPVILLEITRKKFVDFIKTDYKSGVGILWRLARILSARLREADQKLKAFISLTKWI